MLLTFIPFLVPRHNYSVLKSAMANITGENIPDVCLSGKICSKIPFTSKFFYLCFFRPLLETFLYLHSFQLMCFPLCYFSPFSEALVLLPSSQLTCCLANAKACFAFPLFVLFQSSFSIITIVALITTKSFWNLFFGISLESSLFSCNSLCLHQSYSPSHHLRQF